MVENARQKAAADQTRLTRANGGVTISLQQTLNSKDRGAKPGMLTCPELRTRLSWSWCMGRHGVTHARSNAFGASISSQPIAWACLPGRSCYILLTSFRAETWFWLNMPKPSNGRVVSGTKWEKVRTFAGSSCEDDASKCSVQGSATPGGRLCPAKASGKPGRSVFGPSLARQFRTASFNFSIHLMRHQSSPHRANELPNEHALHARVAASTAGWDREATPHLDCPAHVCPHPSQSVCTVALHALQRKQNELQAH